MYKRRLWPEDLLVNKSTLLAPQEHEVAHADTDTLLKSGEMQIELRMQVVPSITKVRTVH